MNKNQILSELAAMQATLPEPGPNDHLPYVEGPEDLGRVIGRRSGFLISPHYSLSARARKSLADIERLGG